MALEGQKELVFGVLVPSQLKAGYLLVDEGDAGELNHDIHFGHEQMVTHDGRKGNSLWPIRTSGIQAACV
jgi:hypothetical protein